MQGVERSHLNAAIMAGLKAFYDFLHSTIAEALSPISTYGKGDTLGMDSGPEITICDELRRYDHGAVVVTEEVGSKSMITDGTYRLNDPSTFRTVFISDPTDRSNQLKEFLREFPQEREICEILNDPNSIEQWEDKFNAPATITGAVSAISCIRRGIPIFAVIINYITREMTISCAAGNRIVKLPEKRPELIDLSYVLANGTPITFPHLDGKLECMRRFITFMGDVGKVGYRENLTDSGLMSEEDIKKHIHYDKPGGPARILYLSSLQPRDEPIGFILANGEKIGEWIHWLPFVQFARSTTDASQSALVLHETSQDRPWTKDGVLMSTPPIYSALKQNSEGMFIDTGTLLSMPNPSRYRSTLIVAPHDNRWAMRTNSQSGYREIKF